MGGSVGLGKTSSRVNEPDVRKGLRKITYLALFLGVVFFGKQTQAAANS
jgi:hypothetical protein